MSTLKNKTSFLLFLFLYALVLGSVLIYFRFPADKLVIYCERSFSRLMPGTEFSIDQIHYSFPFSLALDTLKANKKTNDKQELFTIDRVLISPVFSAPTSQFQIKLDAFSGVHGFSLILGPEEKEFTLKDIKLTHLDPARIPFLERATKRKITGSIDATGEYHAVWENDRYSTKGTGQLTLEKGTFDLLLPIFSLNSINLKKFSTDFTLANNTLRCSNGLFHGKELKGDFSGSILFNSALKDGRVSFSGELEPLPPLLKKSTHAKKMILLLKKQRKRGTVPFLLKGTVQKPRFTFET